MKTHPLPSRSVVSLSASALLLATIPAWADCGAGAPTIAALPNLGGTFYRVTALATNGQLVGFSHTVGDLQVHAFRFSPGGITDLGTLGGTSSQGFALNNFDQVVGESVLTGDITSHGFLHNGTVISDLGTLGGDYSTAVSINDAGQIVGHSEIPGNATLEAFIYQGGTMTSLGHLGGEYSTAMAVNQSGDVIGSSLTEPGELHGFLYRGGAMADLGSLGGGYSLAYALNNSGSVVGDSALATGEPRGFVHSGGSMVQVGTLGGTSSTAYGINNADQVIGTSTTVGDAHVRGFLYSGGTITDLGTLGGNYSAPRAINDIGQVVGEAETAGLALRAFLWQNGSMVDLNTLLPTNSGWELSSASFINDAGRIVGQGSLNGESRWFVLDLGGSANNPPVANAGDDQRVECTGLVTLNGNQSSDPDGDSLSYEWSEGNVVLGTNSSITTLLGVGTHTITLKVSDPCGDSALDSVIVQIVADTTPPTISCPGAVTGAGSGNCETIVPDLRSLVVVSDNCTPAGDLVVTQSPAAGTVVGSGQYDITVTVTDAAGNSASCKSTIVGGDTVPPIVHSPSSVTNATGDNCQAPVPDLKGLFVVEDNCTPVEALTVVQNPAAGTFLPKGEHLIAVTVTDAAGNSTSKHVTLKIVDRTAPTIQSITATPNVLTPADNSKITVNVSVVATDNCDPAPAAKIVEVLCNERTERGDIEIQGDLSVRLIAAKKSNGNGRTYTIIVDCKDSSGNCTKSSVSVEVQKTGGQELANESRRR